MANDFSSDTNCKALWKFESGALTTDSKGSNTLTDNGTVGSDTVNYKEGSGCADFEYSNSEYFSITDANVDSGFPLKSGDTTKKISVCMWVKAEAFTSSFPVLFGKYKTTTGGRTFSVALGSNDQPYIAIGYSNGGAGELSSYFGTALSTAKWYHIGATFDDSDKSYRLRIWDDSAGDFLGTDLTGNFTNNVYLSSITPWAIGARGDSSMGWDGLVDEVVVFDKILTTTEIDDIRQGQYGGGVLPIECNVSDGFSMSDVTAKQAIFSALAQESVNLADTDQNIGNFIAALVDQITMSAATGRTASFDVAVSDGITLTDAVSTEALAVIAAIVSDALSFSDSSSSRASLVASILDSLEISEDVINSLVALAAATDAVNISDSVFWQGIQSALAADSLSVNDQVAAAVKILATAAESVRFDDSGAVTATFDVEINDAVQFAETITTIAALRASVADGIRITATPMEISTLPNGKVTVSFSLKTPGADLEMKTATIIFNLK